MAPERKLYQKLKSKTPKIIWNRLENLSLSGTPDLLGYNTSGHFFTIELKVTKGNKIRFSPHQIAWINRHITLGAPVFVLARDPRSKTIKLFSGSIVRSPHTVDKVPSLISIPARPRLVDWEQVLALLGSWCPGDSPLSIAVTPSHILH